MKSGAEYEKFVFAKLGRLWPDAVVKLNDKIRGRESKFDREIDVSIRMVADDTELLYVVQCKDWNSRVDINTLGAFSAVMQDVGAAKGFLLCTSGFHSSNRSYALARGIELVTIEDITSDRWNVKIEIPFVYVRKKNIYHVSIGIEVSEALAELNRHREVTFRVGESTTMFRVEAGPPVTLGEYLCRRVKDPALCAQEGVQIDLGERNLEIEVAGVWTGCTHLLTVLHINRVRYLKYVTPTEYSQLRDHVRQETLPLHLKLEGVRVRLDESFVELPADFSGSFPGLWLQVEESSIVPHLG